MSGLDWDSMYDDGDDTVGDEPAKMSESELWADAADTFDRVPAVVADMLGLEPDTGTDKPRRAESSPFADSYPIRPVPAKKRRLFITRKALEEEAEAEDLTLINRTFNQSRLIVVANEKGAAGKSPNANLIAAGFGNYATSYPTLLLENNPTGDMDLVLEAHGEHTFDEMIADIQAGRRVDPLAYVTPQPTGRFAALPSAKRRSENRAALSEVEFDIGWRALDRHFKFIVCDEGNNADYDSSHAALAKANVVVIPLVWSENTLAGAYGIAKHLYDDLGTRALVQNAIFVEALDPEGVDAEIKAEFQEVMLSPLRPDDELAARYPEWGPRILRIPWVNAWNAKKGSHVDLRWSSQTPQMRRAIRRVCAEIAVKIRLLDEYPG
jgi:hypothetical protein